MVFCLMALLWPAHQLTASQPEAIPLDLQMQIFLKIMTYNRSLAIEKLDAFVVTIVYSQTQGRGIIDEHAAQLKETLSSKTILGRPIKLHIVGLGKSFKSGMVPASHLVVLHGRLDDAKPPLLSWLHEQKTLSAAAMQDAEPKEVVILLRLDDEKPAIHFNLNLARQLGLDFHAQFLKHCIITK